MGKKQTRDRRAPSVSAVGSRREQRRESGAQRKECEAGEPETLPLSVNGVRFGVMTKWSLERPLQNGLKNRVGQ